MCGNHQGFICERTVLSAMGGMTHLYNIFSVAQFPNFGSHLLRCCIASDSFVDSRLKLRHGEPSEQDKEYMAEMTAFILMWSETDSQRDAPNQQARKARRIYRHCLKTYLANYFKIVHSGFSIESDEIVSYTTDVITLELQADIVKKVSKAARGVNFTSKVPPVFGSKWTKGGPALSRLVLGLMNGMLPGVGVAALGEVSFIVKAPNAADPDSIGMDHIQEYGTRTWKYAGRFKTAMWDPVEKMLRVLECIVQEGFRYLTLTLCKMGSKSSVSREGQPAISSLTNDRSSVVYLVMCYYTALLKGKSSRLLLAVVARGCDSVKDWQCRYPMDWEKIRRASAGSTAVLQRRLRSVYMQLHRQLWSICDPRVIDEEALCMTTQFLAVEEHLLPVGMARNVSAKYKGRGPAALVSRMRSMRVGAFIVPVTVWKVENRHAGHQRRADNKGSVPHLHTVAAMSTTNQSQEQHNACRHNIKDALKITPVVEDSPGIPSSRQQIGDLKKH